MRERVIIIIIIINYLAHVPYPPDHHSLWTRLQLAQRLSTAAAKFQLFHEHHTPTTGPINIHRRRLKVTSPLVSSPAHAAFIVRAVSRLSSTNGETWNEAQANTLRPFNPPPPFSARARQQLLDSHMGHGPATPLYDGQVHPTANT